MLFIDVPFEPLEPYFVQAKDLICSNYTVLAYALCFLIIVKLCFYKRTVNCWFCSTNSVVNYAHRNSWTCGNCDQYNGFTKTGDYNIKIPAMHNEHENSNGSAAFGAQEYNECPWAVPPRTEFCKKCSRNQLLKVKQISKFKSISVENYDDEFKDFSDKLEDLYALCKVCEQNVSRHVKTQDTIIRGNLKNLNLQKFFSSSTSRLSPSGKQGRNTEKSSPFAPGILQQNTTLLQIFASVLHAGSSLAIISPKMFPISSVTTVLPQSVRNYTSYFNRTLVVSGVLLCLFSSITLRKTKVNRTWNHVCALLWIILALTSFVQFKTTWKLAHYYLLSYKEQLPWINGYIDDAIFTATLAGVTRSLVYSSVIAVFELFLVLSSVKGHMSTRVVSRKPGPKLQKFNYKSPKRSFALKQSKAICEYTDDSCFSDNSSIYSEAGSSVVKHAHISSNLPGTLHALNINDPKGGSQSLFKHPMSSSQENISNSVYATPPPSRSTSMVALDEHVTGNHFQSPTANSRCNQLQGGRSQAMTAQRQYHRTNTASGYFRRPNSNFRTSALNSSPYSMQMNSRIHQRPQQNQQLIARSKFNHSVVSRDGAAMRSTVSKRSPPPPPPNMISRGPGGSGGSGGWENRLDGDVTMNDSVSQIGMSNASEDELLATPQAFRYRTPASNVNLNSSSPKSMVTSFTSMTSQSVRRVENSRFCKWFLAFCVLLNVILVLLVAWEMKKLRESQQMINKT